MNHALAAFGLREYNTYWLRGHAPQSRCYPHIGILLTLFYNVLVYKKTLWCNNCQIQNGLN